MPTPSAADIARLKAIIQRGLRKPNATFSEEDAVVIAQGTGQQFWRELRVSLLAYAYGEGDEGSDDEPEFIVAVSADKSRQLVHEPQVADPPEREKDTRELPDTTVLLHHSLDDEQVHAFFIVCSAFDSDSDTAWSGVVKGLQKDLRNLGSAAIGASVLSGFSTPSALMDFVIQHAGDAATDSPEQIGSQEVVLDLRQEFRRPAGLTSWTVYKWTLFSRPGQDAWYLALWRIELDSRPGALADAGLDRRGGVDNATDVGRVRESLRVGPAELAAVRVLQGDGVEDVAVALGLGKEEVRQGLRDFMDQEADALHQRLLSVALAEQRLARAKVAG